MSIVSNIVDQRPVCGGGRCYYMVNYNTLDGRKLIYSGKAKNTKKVEFNDGGPTFPEKDMMLEGDKTLEEFAKQEEDAYAARGRTLPEPSLLGPYGEPYMVDEVRGDPDREKMEEDRIDGLTPVAKQVKRMSGGGRHSGRRRAGRRLPARLQVKTRKKLGGAKRKKSSKYKKLKKKKSKRNKSRRRR